MIIEDFDKGDYYVLLEDNLAKEELATGNIVNFFQFICIEKKRDHRNFPPKHYILFLIVMI